MFVLTLAIDLRVPQAQSLKEKRSSILSLVRRLDQMHGVAAAEADFLDDKQRSRLVVACVAGSAGHCQSLADSADRLVWSQPKVEVIEIDRVWCDC